MLDTLPSVVQKAYLSDFPSTIPSTVPSDLSSVSEE
jgi:hypothetical protein